ncbi:MAG: hypothetical protein ACFE9Z_07340, partial [Promethearchaeota archaeon]
FFSNYVLISLIIRLTIVYFVSIILIPILRGLQHDMYLIKLKEPYSVQIEFKFKLIKHIEVNSQIIRIYMKSSSLGLKKDQNAYHNYIEISNRRWLPQKGKIKFAREIFSYKVHFYEYSTIINFKEHLLNLISAIREWDLKFRIKNINLD